MKQLRSDFPFFEKNPSYIYFDSAATTQKPKSVLEAIHNFYSYSYAPVHRGVYEHAREATACYELVRGKVKNFINASSEEEIIFTRGTTSSLNLVARSYAKTFLQKGDVVLLSAIEHHSNIVPWQLLAEEKGIELEVIPIDDHGEINLNTYKKKLTKKVKLVSLAHVSNTLGTIHPIKEITKLAHENGARVCIDGAQGIAHIPVDVSDLDVDFYAFSFHKMYGPTGVGVLYGKKELLMNMPPYEGGGNMIDKVSFQKSTFVPPPYRFEAGTPMIVEVIGAGAAIDYLRGIGMDRVAKWEEELTVYALKRLSEVEKIKILGPLHKRGAILSFIVQGFHSLDVATLLDCRKIAVRSGHHCSQPTMERFGIESAIRVSFGLYNTKEEIDYFVKTLQEIINSSYAKRSVQI